MSPRETGVAQTDCPTCGSKLQMVSLPDGALAAENCPTCFGPPSLEPTAEKAAKKAPSREAGTATVVEGGDE